MSSKCSCIILHIHIPLQSWKCSVHHAKNCPTNADVMHMYLKYIYHIYKRKRTHMKNKRSENILDISIYIYTHTCITHVCMYAK